MLSLDLWIISCDKSQLKMQGRHNCPLIFSDDTLSATIYKEVSALVEVGKLLFENYRKEPKLNSKGSSKYFI